ncbi:translation initiation factor IF-2-like [Alexandromys fortis]|uniref:translation initiation factor IF-2-like n=1 Tax=Alexandromys fortis TaxID=100897 RepID=UPI00215292C2|nr:translation initiation factor IF-2-like [Microtus fortis]
MVQLVKEIDAKPGDLRFQDYQKESKLQESLQHLYGTQGKSRKRDTECGKYSWVDASLKQQDSRPLNNIKTPSSSQKYGPFGRTLQGDQIPASRRKFPLSAHSYLRSPSSRGRKASAAAPGKGAVESCTRRKACLGRPHFSVPGRTRLREADGLAKVTVLAGRGRGAPAPTSGSPFRRRLGAPAPHPARGRAPSADARTPLTRATGVRRRDGALQRVARPPARPGAAPSCRARPAGELGEKWQREMGPRERRARAEGASCSPPPRAAAAARLVTAAPTARLPPPPPPPPLPLTCLRRRLRAVLPGAALARDCGGAAVDSAAPPAGHPSPGPRRPARRRSGSPAPSSGAGVPPYFRGMQNHPGAGCA